MNKLNIVRYHPKYREQVVDLTVRAWKPVFAKTKNEVPRFVFDAFYPQGWRDRQIADVTQLLDTEPDNIWLGLQDDELTGFIGIRIHPEDQMGEIYIVAVAPDYQQQGNGRRLMEFAEGRIRATGMKIVMVETIGDSGHESARRAYESLSYERWPVVRYFKPL